MSACFKACFRALVFMASITLCVCGCQAPAENLIITKDFSADRACDSLALVTYSSTSSITFNCSTVPASGNLFKVVLNYKTYRDHLICNPARLPEQSTTYTVTLIATGSGVYDSRNVTINHQLPISNTADPQFGEGSDLHISIPKDSFEKGDTSLRIFTVTDADGDTVTLSIPDGTPFNVTGMEIQIAASLKNKDSPFSLTVTATDNGSPTRNSEVVLKITLLNAPVFTVLENEKNISICENYTEGGLVTALTATDADGDTITFSVVSVDPDVDYFVVEGNEVKVKSGVANDTFDVDTPGAVTRYAVALRASDGTQSSDIKVHIVVKDFNDNAPKFTEAGPLTAQLLETSPNDTEVYTVIVTDDDRDDGNKNFTFQLTGSPTFDINDEGIICVTNSGGLDYKVEPECVLTITVNDTDDPDTTLSVSKNLSVVIETAPTFINVLPINVNESVPVGTVISTITVQDVDSLPNPLLIITISEDSDHADAFEVVEENKLKIKTELDAEAKQTYTLKFSCTDGKHTTPSINMTINVGDVNDNVPVILPISDIHLDEDTVPGGVLANVSTTDADVTTLNNVVTWFIESGNEDGYFGASSGSITLVSRPSSMTQNEFVLTIKATDGGYPPLSLTMNVSVIFSEDSVDECESIPCQNDATCSSYVNAFACTCTPGWLGEVCDSECTENKFGQDCEQSCNCNVSRVANNRQDQTCHPVTGDCRCNDFWEGVACETDINECEVQPNVCDIAEHRLCDNFDGGYACICENGYREIDNTCQDDECLQSPCENSGTCTDTLSGFTCACTPGWKLNTNCTQECGSNTFGQDCGQRCNCNVSRVADSAQNQTCDRVIGDCRCNAQWTGAVCETDIDECQNVNTCDATLKKVCKNEIGYHRCLCQQHYNDINGTCVKFEEKSNITAGQLVATLYLRTPNCSEYDLDKPWKYEALKTKLENGVRKEIKEINKDKKKLIFVYNIRCGSIKFDVAFPTSNNFEDTEQLVSAIEELKTNGTLVYDNQTVPLAITDIGFSKGGNDSTLKPVKDFCKQSVCHRCEAVNTVIQCKIIPADHQLLIWALFVFVIVLVLLGSITWICYHRMKLNEKRNKRSKPYRKDHRSIPKMEKSDSDSVFRGTVWQIGNSSFNVPPLEQSLSFNQRYRSSPYRY